VPHLNTLETSIVLRALYKLKSLRIRHFRNDGVERRTKPNARRSDDLVTLHRKATTNGIRAGNRREVNLAMSRESRTRRHRTKTQNRSTMFTLLSRPRFISVLYYNTIQHLQHVHSQLLRSKWGGAVLQRVTHLGLRSVGHGFKSCTRQRCVTTLGKLFTPMCL